MNFKLAFAALAIAPLLFVACGDSAGTDGSDGTTAPDAEAEITAAEGGNLTHEESGFTLTIPAGSLAEDLTITLQVAPKASDTVSQVFTVAPAGTVLEIPADLAIDSTASVPDGKKLVIGEKIDGAWSEVEGSAQGSGGVYGAVTRLGTFAAVLVDLPASACDATCMAQTGAVCCDTGCGCQVSDCIPVCAAPYQWDCEMVCCFDYTLLECAP